MIADLTPYPAYRDSGVEWLGPVPEHWDLKRTKSVLSSSESGVWGTRCHGPRCHRPAFNRTDPDGRVGHHSTREAADHVG